MIFFEFEDIVPRIEIYGAGPILKDHILRAYKDLKSMIHGVSDVIRILDDITEGCYTIGEVTIAGLLLTEGVKGTVMESLYKGTLLCVNGCDFLAFEDEILTNVDFHYQHFSPDRSDKVYVLKPVKAKQRELAKKEAAATANSNRPKKTSNAPKSPKV